MAFERRWPAASQYFTADGSATGLILVQDVSGFYVKQIVTIKAQLQPDLVLEIKRIEGTTEIYVGLPGDINARQDVSAYTLQYAAIIIANEQIIRPIKPDEITNAMFEREPVTAQRVVSVDEYGTKFDKENRFPTDPAGQSTQIMINLLNMQVSDLDPDLYLVNNDGFFIFDNAGNFIKAG